MVATLLLVAMQLVAIPASHANAVAGRVLFVKGPNSVDRDGPTVGLLKGSFIFEGDTINTGDKARIQLLMVDGARIAIRPNTTFGVQTYELPESTTDSFSIANNDGKATLRLVKGAFRSITGRIGKSHVKANYQVIAPVATLGIRGTDYTVRFCSSDCGGDGSGPDPDDGLYIGVSVGGVWVQNAEGSLDIDKNEFAFIADAVTAPLQLLEPPGLLYQSAVSEEDEEEKQEE